MGRDSIGARKVSFDMTTKIELYAMVESTKRAYDIARKTYHLYGRDVKGNHWACYWTRPFGHIYGPHPLGSSWDGMCIFCGAEVNYYD